MKMSIRKFVIALPIFLSMLSPVNAEAASAVGRVSVNILPSATASLSGAIVISDKSGNNQANSGSINLSTTGMDHSKLKVSNSYNTYYNVSISSPNTIKDTNGQNVTVKQLSVSSDNNQTHYISGTFTKNNNVMLAQNSIAQTNADPYAEAISITVNYN